MTIDRNKFFSNCFVTDQINKLPNHLLAGNWFDPLGKMINREIRVQPDLWNVLVRPAYHHLAGLKIDVSEGGNFLKALQ